MVDRASPDLAEQEGTFEKAFPKTFEKMRVLKTEYLLTRRCNLQCGYCRIRDESSLRGPEMDTEAVLRSIEIIGENWPGSPIIFYGGEPCLREDLPMVIRRCRELGVKAAVISNSIRVVKDEDYREALLDAGLENWSVSLDAMTPEHAVDGHSFSKSMKGLRALLMMRSQGVRDLVACITVSRYNIRHVPDIVSMLTNEGCFAVCTPLHIGGPQYEYGQGRWEDMPSQEDIELVSPILYEMAASGSFLISNDPEWFNVWPKHFRKQDWMCNDKGLLTVDADGSLRYCVDIPFRLEDQMTVHELATEEGQQKFLRAVSKGPPCKGCLWNPAYECIMRARNPGIGIEEGRRRARHEVPPEQLPKLPAHVRQLFEGNPTLQRVR